MRYQGTKPMNGTMENVPAAVTVFDQKRNVNC
jgi:hypothetical protein